LILVRHGETAANRARHFAEHDEIPLTQTGREQARELAALLARDFKPDVLLSSPYIRARETSEIIGAALSLEPEILPGTHERNFGSLKGHPYERMGELMLADALYDATQPWHWTPPDGESLEQVRHRTAAAIETLHSRGVDEVVLVCHGAVIQSICAHVTGEWRETFVPPNCGFVVIEHLGEKWSHPVIAGEWECLDT